LGHTNTSTIRAYLAGKPKTPDSKILKWLVNQEYVEADEKAQLRVNIPCQTLQLSSDSKKSRIWFPYLASASVGMKISDGGDRETPRYRREWEESFGSKGIDIF
jgi:hypothetical protein